MSTPAVATAEIAAPPGLPYLVSYPRTGSHWLRCFLELYFDRPLLTRSFFEHPSSEPLLYHTHDVENEIVDARPSIYLYRSVVNTVFSELTYRHGDKAAACRPAQVMDVARAYHRHLRKWLLDPPGGASGDLHIMAYEWLLDRPLESLSGCVRFLGAEPDGARIMEIWPTVTHDSVKAKTAHDPRVVRDDKQLHLRRDLFRFRYGGAVVDVFRADEELCAVMDPRLLC